MDDFRDHQQTLAISEASNAPADPREHVAMSNAPARVDVPMGSVKRTPWPESKVHSMAIAGTGWCRAVHAQGENWLSCKGKRLMWSVLSRGDHSHVELVTA